MKATRYGLGTRMAVMVLAGSAMVGGAPARAALELPSGVISTFKQPILSIRPADETPAEAALRAFRNSTKGTVWTALTNSKQVILQQIEARLEDRTRVRPVLRKFTGPQKILFELIRLNPIRYVKLCQSIFEEGRFTTAQKTVTASLNLRTSQVPDGMAAVDWMVMATMRENEGVTGVFAFDEVLLRALPVGSNVSSPADMVGWTKELLELENVRWEPVPFQSDFSALRHARDSVADGGVAIMLFHDALLGSGDEFLPVPNLWGSLLPGAVVQNERTVEVTERVSIGFGITIEVETTRTVPGSTEFEVFANRIETISASEARFNNLFSGVILGER